MPINQRSDVQTKDAVKVVTVSVLAAMANGAAVLPLLLLVVQIAFAG